MERYIVIETQTDASGNMAIPAGLPAVYYDLNEAESRMHGILQYAAISSVPEHSAFILDGRGDKVDGHTFVHLPAPNGEAAT